MRKNGSPDPVFETDEHATYFLTTLPAVVTNQASNQVGNQVKALVLNDLESIVDFTNQVSNGVSNEVSNEAYEQVSSILNVVVYEKVEDILTIVQNYSKSKEILEGIGLTNQTKNRKRYLDPLLELGWIGMLNPEVRTDPTQMYKITASGRRLLNLLKRVSF